MNWRPRTLRIALAGAGLLVCDVGVERIVLPDGVFLGQPVAPFDPPLFCDPQKQALRRIREQLTLEIPAQSKFDPELGWCNKPNSGFGEFRYDWAGARIGRNSLSPEKPESVRRVLALGCSMTHGEEVSARDSWCSRVDDLRPDLEIGNLGVAAYGIDQALMRLRRDGWGLAPDEVWLGVLPQAALRVTTLFRPLLDHWSIDVAFKPKLLLQTDGELTTKENPASELSDVSMLLENQDAFLKALGPWDPWIQRSRLAYSPRGSSLLHYSFCGRILLTITERSGRHVEQCFDPETDFGAVFSAIVVTMSRECEDRGCRFLVLVLPGRSDLAYRRKAVTGYWDAWVALMAARGITTVDLSEALEASGAGDDLYMPGGHYSSLGNEIVARELANRL